MKKWIQGIVAALLCGGLWLNTGCVGVGYSGESAYYDYNYYPDSDVYYYPEGHVYYWNEDGRWCSGERLPERYDLHEHHYEHFRGHSRQPWTERHEEHGADHGHQHD